MAHIAYKFRFYPTPEQEIQLRKQVGSCRWLWNKMLEMNIEKYEMDKKFIFHTEMCKMLTDLKKDVDWLKLCNSQALQAVLKSLDAALKMFFKHKNENWGFPQFKSKHFSSKSFVVPQHFSVEDRYFVIPKIGNLKWKKHRKIYGTPKRLSISLDVDQWFVSVVCEVPEAPENLEIDHVVGIDLGLKDFAVTSDAEIIKSPSYKAIKKKQKRQQRSLSRKEKGSRNYEKQRLKLARLHRKERRMRSDFLHQMSSSIAKTADLVAMENLNTKGMMKNRNLARCIGEQGWYMFKVLVEQKMRRKGGFFVEIGKFFPSTKTCSSCGWIQPMPLTKRTYVCHKCAVEIPRDLNAAFNIAAEGLRIVRSDRPELKLVENHCENFDACRVEDSSRFCEARSPLML